MMFNNLGLYARVRAPRRGFMRMAPKFPGITQIGGSGTDIFINEAVGQPGPPGPPGPPGSLILPVSQVTATPYPATTSELVLVVNVSGPSSIILPAATTPGKLFSIKDASGNATANPITISSVSPIDGLSLTPTTINIDFGSITLVATGTEWNII